MKQINDLSHGESFGIFVLIKSADIRTARNGNPFIAFRFQDRSGAIDGMYWSAKEDEIARFQPGKVAFLRGTRDTYNGQPQVKIEGLRIAEAGEPNDPSLYLERIDEDLYELQEHLDNALAKIHEPNIARVVRKILKEVGQDFYSFPAAKRNHHALVGGLSLHTITMLQVAEKLIEVYPQLNPSLLFGGIILHDIGKTIELSGPISTEYTLQGKLQGHIVIVSEMIDRASREIGINPDETEAILLLKHMVLAHHGQLEFGSPVKPQVLEAEVIHYIDDMDAKITMISDVLANTKGGDFSSQVYPLDRRAFYKPHFND